MSMTTIHAIATARIATTRNTPTGSAIRVIARMKIYSKQYYFRI